MLYKINTTESGNYARRTMKSLRRRHYRYVVKPNCLYRKGSIVMWPNLAALHAALSFALLLNFLCRKQHSNSVLPFGAWGAANYDSPCSMQNVTMCAACVWSALL